VGILSRENNGARDVPECPLDVGDRYPRSDVTFEGHTVATVNADEMNNVVTMPVAQHLLATLV
jgi:hypothetical protein